MSRKEEIGKRAKKVDGYHGIRGGWPTNDTIKTQILFICDILNKLELEVNTIQNKWSLKAIEDKLEEMGKHSDELLIFTKQKADEENEDKN
jgi:hypothetical protein